MPFSRRIRLTNAELAIVCVVVAMLLLITILTFVPRTEPWQRWPASRVKNDHRSLATALESYFVDHRTYPPAVPLSLYAKNESTLINAGGAHAMALAGCITTPISYVTSLFSDPFAPERTLTFAYHTDGPGWVLYSPGPDCDYDLVPTEDYNGSIIQPGPRMVLKAFDPTNGAVSGGDVWRVKQ